METGPYYQPQSIAPILERGAAQQVPFISQPKGLSGALPAIGNLAQSGFDVAAQNQKKQSLFKAQQVYSDYLSKVDSGTATQQDHAQGRMAALSLGIAPLDTLGINYKNTQIENMRSEIKARENKPSKGVSVADLSPEEDAAWQKAIKEHRLAPSQISFRGPKRKDLAKQFLSDPTYNATREDINFSAGKSGAAAGARLNEGGAAQMTARTANAANAQLDILSEISRKFPRSNVQLMNTPIIKLDAQTMPEAQNWVIALNSFRNEYASALMRGHMPQGEAQHEVAKALPENITPRQLESAIPLLRRELNALVKGQMTPATGKEGSSHPQDSEAIAWATANPNDPRSAKILSLNGK